MYSHGNLGDRALLRADIKSEVKDLMMGHARQSARKHYDYDEITIKELLSINGLQVRADLKKVMRAKNLDLQKINY